MFSICRQAFIFIYIFLFMLYISSFLSFSRPLVSLDLFYLWRSFFILSNLSISSLFHGFHTRLQYSILLLTYELNILTWILAPLYWLIGQYTQYVLLKKIFSYPYSEKLHNFLLLYFSSWFCFVYSLFNIFWFLIGLISYLFSLNILWLI